MRPDSISYLLAAVARLDGLKDEPMKWGKLTSGKTKRSFVERLDKVRELVARALRAER